MSRVALLAIHTHRPSQGFGCSQETQVKNGLAFTVHTCSTIDQDVRSLLAKYRTGA